MRSRFFNNLSCIPNNYTGIAITKHGDMKRTAFYENGKLHRTDGPAEIWSTGLNYYFVDGGIREQL